MSTKIDRNDCESIHGRSRVSPFLDPRERERERGKPFEATEEQRDETQTAAAKRPTIWSRRQPTTDDRQAVAAADDHKKH